MNNTVGCPQADNAIAPKTMMAPTYEVSSPTGQCPEIDLLLSCASTDLSTAAAANLSTLGRHAFDWSRLLQSAMRHRLIPLLYRNLTKGHAQQIPEKVLAQLKYLNSANAFKNLYLAQQLETVLALFDAHGIPALSYKGPTLATSVYGNLSLRQFCDLDILVSPADVPAAMEILATQGYKLQMNLGWEYHFSNEDYSVTIDLHQSLVPAFFYLPSDFISPTVSEIAPEDLLLLLSILFAKDCCHWKVRLNQLCDVAELIRSTPQLDWTQVEVRAKDIGCERILWMTLRLTQSLLEAKLPPHIDEKVNAQGIITELVQEVQTRLWREIDNPSPVPDNAGFWEYFRDNNHGFYLKLRERPREKVGYCWHWLWKFLRFGVRPNQADQAMFHLPQGLSFLYYPLHVLRLFIKYAVLRTASRLKKIVKLS